MEIHVVSIDVPFAVQGPGAFAGRILFPALFVSLLTVGVRPVAAIQDSRELYQFEAVRIAEGPVIDGSMDEAVWQRAAVIDQFIQQEPEEGAPATERTEVRVLYDGSTLYVGVRAYDSGSDAVIASELRRDSDRLLDEDNFQIILDTFNDSRSAYMFVTSPLGAKLEQQIFEEGEGGRRGFSTNNNINRNWDGVWYVSTQQLPDGWIAEIAIPMVTVRFPDSERQDWGINFMRNIRRKNEQVFWAPIPKAYTLTRVSLAGSLTDLESLNRGLDLRIKPFVLGGGRRVSNSGVQDNSTQEDFGVDVKYGVTAGMNLDLTANTDFAQAEIDDEQINLTRFPLFFPEKREFFLENAGQFNVGTSTSTFRVADLFFSRRIGLSDTGDPVPILGGARLTGKMGRNNIAVMDLQTDDVFGTQGENFMVARYSRDVFARSKVGAMLINKEVTGSTYFNRTFAVDMAMAPHPSLAFNGFLAGTSTEGVSDGQMGGHVRAAWLDQSWNINAEYTDLQDNFNPEVGFVPRRGIRTSKIHLERTPRPGRYGLRVLQPMINLTYTADQNNRLVSRRLHHMLGIGFSDGSTAIIFYNRKFERLDNPFTLQGVVVPVGSYRFGDWRFMYNSNQARRVYSSVSYAPQTFFDGTRTDWSISVGFRATSRLSTEGQVARNEVDLAGGSFTADLASFRIDYALSPTMTLRTLTQYNSLTDEWSTSARLNYIYRPGSDIYLVYDELRRDGPGLEWVRDRRLLLKFTYLLSR
jgi:hypothetical protein